MHSEQSELGLKCRNHRPFSACCALRCNAMRDTPDAAVSLSSSFSINSQKKSPHRGRAAERRSPARSRPRSRLLGVFSGCLRTGRRGWNLNELRNQRCRSSTPSLRGSAELSGKVAAPPLSCSSSPPSPPLLLHLSAPPRACWPSAAACEVPGRSGAGPDSRRSLSALWQGFAGVLGKWRRRGEGQ